MARARNLKPSFFTDDEVAELQPLCRLLFQGLWCMSDREGRLEDRPKKIKAEILPYDNCNVEKMLTELAMRRFILRYERNGARFIQVRQFKKHQNPHIKEPESTIPAPDSPGAKTGASTVLDTEQEPEIPERARLILDSGFRIPPSGFPLPDSSALIPDSGPRLSDSPFPPPDSGFPQPVATVGADPKQHGPSGKNGNGAVESNAKSRTKTGMELDNPAWIAATSITVNRPRREGESYKDWKDAVVTLVQQRQAQGRVQHT